MPRVRDGFLEEVVTELGTSKSQPEVWVGLPVEGWLSRSREARCFSFLRAGKQSGHPRPESVSGPVFLGMNRNHGPRALVIAGHREGLSRKKRGPGIPREGGQR